MTNGRRNATDFMTGAEKSGGWYGFFFELSLYSNQLLMRLEVLSAFKGRHNPCQVVFDKKHSAYCTLSFDGFDG